MKILVTGGLGYIGSHCCKYLLENGYEVVIIDNLINTSSEVLQDLNSSKLKFYELDIRDYESLKKIFKEAKIDIVIHFASLKSVGESVSNSLLYYENNVLGTINLLKVMKKYGCTKMIFSSSACVYPVKDQSNEESDEINLDKLLNPYGKTKFIIEQILKDVVESYSFQIIILRYFNPIGIIKPMKIWSKNIVNLADVIVESIQKDKQFKVFGNDYETRDGTCIRDYIHIYDLVIGHLKAMDFIKEKNDSIYEIFNLGTNQGVTVFELIKTFENVHNIKLNYVVTERRCGDNPISISSCNKAKNVLGWKVTKSLEDICKDMI